MLNTRSERDQHKGKGEISDPILSLRVKPRQMRPEENMGQPQEFAKGGDTGGYQLLLVGGGGGGIGGASARREYDANLELILPYPRKKKERGRMTNQKRGTRRRTYKDRNDRGPDTRISSKN